MLLIISRNEDRPELESKILAAAFRQSVERGDIDGSRLAHRELVGLLARTARATDKHVDLLERIFASDIVPLDLQALSADKRREAAEAAQLAMKPEPLQSEFAEGNGTGTHAGESNEGWEDMTPMALEHPPGQFEPEERKETAEEGEAEPAPVAEETPAAEQAPSEPELEQGAPAQATDNGLSWEAASSIYDKVHGRSENGESHQNKGEIAKEGTDIVHSLEVPEITDEEPEHSSYSERALEQTFAPDESALETANQASADVSALETALDLDELMPELELLSTVNDFSHFAHNIFTDSFEILAEDETLLASKAFSISHIAGAEIDRETSAVGDETGTNESQSVTKGKRRGSRSSKAKSTQEQQIVSAEDKSTNTNLESSAPAELAAALTENVSTAQAEVKSEDEDEDSDIDPAAILSAAWKKVGVETSAPDNHPAEKDDLSVAAQSNAENAARFAEQAAAEAKAAEIKAAEEAAAARAADMDRATDMATAFEEARAGAEARAAAAAKTAEIKAAEEAARAADMVRATDMATAFEEARAGAEARATAAESKASAEAKAAAEAKATAEANKSSEAGEDLLSAIGHIVVPEPTMEEAFEAMRAAAAAAASISHVSQEVSQQASSEREPPAFESEQAPPVAATENAAVELSPPDYMDFSAESYQSADPDAAYSNIDFGGGEQSEAAEAPPYSIATLLSQRAAPDPDSPSYYPWLAAEVTDPFFILHVCYLRAVRRLLVRQYSAEKGQALHAHEFKRQLKNMGIAFNILYDPRTRLDFDLRQLGLREPDYGNGLQVPKEARLPDAGGKAKVSFSEILIVCRIFDADQMLAIVNAARLLSEQRFWNYLAESGLLTVVELDSIKTGFQFVCNGLISIYQFEQAFQYARTNQQQLLEVLLAAGWVRMEDLQEFANSADHEALPEKPKFIETAVKPQESSAVAAALPIQVAASMPSWVAWGADEAETSDSAAGGAPNTVSTISPSTQGMDFADLASAAKSNLENKEDANKAPAATEGSDKETKAKEPAKHVVDNRLQNLINEIDALGFLDEDESEKERL